MELILISESKLKITLTAEDMEVNGISEDQLTCGEKDVRRIFEGVLDEAKKKTGFDAECGRLYVQVYPSKTGGCEVYFIRGEVGKSNRQPKPRTKREYCVYVFDGAVTAMDACAALKTNRYECESDLYAERRGGRCRYYLVLQEELPGEKEVRRRKYVCKSDVAGEYGVRLGGKEILPYLRERCECLAESDAVSLLG